MPLLADYPQCRVRVGVCFRLFLTAIFNIHFYDVFNSRFLGFFYSLFRLCCIKCTPTACYMISVYALFNLWICFVTLLVFRVDFPLLYVIHFPCLICIIRIHCMPPLVFKNCSFYYKLLNCGQLVFAELL